MSLHVLLRCLTVGSFALLCAQASAVRADVPATDRAALSTNPACDIANPILPCDLNGRSFDTFAGNYAGNRSFYKASSYDIDISGGYLCLTIKNGLPHSDGYAYVPHYSATVWTSPAPYKVDFGVFGVFGGSCIEQANHFEWTGVGAQPWLGPKVPANPFFIPLVNTPTAANAVVIAHGWRSNASDWVYKMAGSLCNGVNGAIQRTASQITPDALQQICHTPTWDVWVQDWRTAAGPLADDAWTFARSFGNALATYMKSLGYQHLHLVAHSAGANLVDTATRQLKGLNFFPQIHETFLDPYDPSAPGADNSLIMSGSPYIGRHFSSYGEKADWADSYVDTRKLVDTDLGIDKTDLHLKHAYNIDVTPSQDNCAAGLEGVVCRHGRPYRFYQKSLSGEESAVDPIGDTVGLGSPLSLENSRTLLSLLQQFPPGGECQVKGSNCKSVSSSTHLAQSLLLVDVTRSLNSTVGQAACLTVSCNGLRIGQTLPRESESLPTKSTGASLAPASWLVLDIVSASAVNTLSFDWHFVVDGGALLQIYVDGRWIGNLDQRYLPAESTQPLYLFVGDIAPGPHKLAFRLDDYGSGNGGLEITGIAFSLRTVLVASLDVDASNTGSRFDALTDGLLVIRYLFGLTGTSLVSGAIGGTASRSSPTDIKTYLDSIRGFLDIDGDGRSDALTDGLLILRYLFGLRGSALVAGAVNPQGIRTSTSDIETYIQSLVPQ